MKQQQRTYKQILHGSPTNKPTVGGDTIRH